MDGATRFNCQRLFKSYTCLCFCLYSCPFLFTIFFLLLSTNSNSTSAYNILTPPSSLLFLLLVMYQYSEKNNSSSPLPAARLQSRPRFNTGEEYPLQQTSYSSGGGTPPYNTPYSEPLGYYDTPMAGPDAMQQPLLNHPTSPSSMSSSVKIGNVQFGGSKSNMVGGGPVESGMAPRRQTRRYKTSK